MKLKHLLFGSMIALAFTACSEKDTLPEEPDVKVKTTSLSLKLDPFTRAEGANIASLNVVIANAEGNIEVIDDADTQELLDQISVVDIELSAGAKQVVVFANLPEDVIDAYAVGTPLDGLLAETAKLAFNTHEGEPTVGDELLFTMSSKVHDITIYEGESHYLGFPNATGNGEVYYNANGEDDTPVRLYRNVAKVIVSDITLGDVYIERSTLELPEGVERTRLHNPAFTINEIAVVQSMAESRLAGTDFGEWASTFVEGSTSYVSGYTAEEYTAFAEGINFVKITDEAAVIEGNDLYCTTYDEAIDADDYATETNPVREFFVYENPYTNAEDILTLVTVKGTISGNIWIDVDGDDVQDEGELQPLSIDDRYYTVAVGVTGFGETGFTIGDEAGIYEALGRNNAGDNYLGVFRNLQYNISMSLTGRGSPSPFGPPEGGELAELDVKAVVVPWGTVTQDTGVE